MTELLHISGEGSVNIDDRNITLILNARVT